MKIFFSILIFYSFLFIDAFADVKFSNYKDYKITNTNFQLEEIWKGLNYPWGMTFIDEENLLITEKSGGLLRINGIYVYTHPRIGHVFGHLENKNELE